MERPVRRKSPSFRRFYLGFAAVLLCAVLCGLCVLWAALRSYEDSMPIHAAEKILDLFVQRRDSEIAGYCGFLPDKFEDNSALSLFLDEKLGEEPALSLKKERTTDGSAVYQLLSGEASLAEVILQQSADVDFFGNHTWQPDFISGLISTDTCLTIYAPSFVTVSVNGISLSDAEATGNGKMIDAYRSLPASFSHPTLKEYKIYGLLNKPVLTAEAADGSLCEITEEKDTPDTFLVQAHLPGDEAENLRQLAVDIAETYAKFVTKDASKTAVLDYLVPETDLYRRVRSFDNSWYIEHDSYAFENLEVTDPVRYSPDHVSCRISFLYRIKMGRKEFEFPSSYEVYMVNTDEGWKAADMPIL